MAYEHHQSSSLTSTSDSINPSYATQQHPAELESPQDIALQDRATDEQIAQDEGIPHHRTKGPLWGVLVASLVCANLLISMDNTIVADIQTPLILDLGDYTNFPWVAVGFSLGAVSLNLFW